MPGPSNNLLSNFFLPFLHRPLPFLLDRWNLSCKRRHNLDGELKSERLSINVKYHIKIVEQSTLETSLYEYIHYVVHSHFSGWTYNSTTPRT